MAPETATPTCSAGYPALLTSRRLLWRLYGRRRSTEMFRAERGGREGQAKLSGVSSREASRAFRGSSSERRGPSFSPGRRLNRRLRDRCVRGFRPTARFALLGDHANLKATITNAPKVVNAKMVTRSTNIGTFGSGPPCSAHGARRFCLADVRGPYLVSLPRRGAMALGGKS